MGQLLNYAEGRIAIFDTKLFAHWEDDDDKNSFIVEVDVEYPLKLNERDDKYPFAFKVLTIESGITGEMKHNLRDQ